MQLMSGLQTEAVRKCALAAKQLLLDRVLSDSCSDETVPPERSTSTKSIQKRCSDISVLDKQCSDKIPLNQKPGQRYLQQASAEPATEPRNLQHPSAEYLCYLSKRSERKRENYCCC